MLTLFNRIQRRLLAGGSIYKYVAYAIGEIVLVVIGILIAIQINARYQRVLDQTEEINILDDLKAEFEKQRAPI